MLNQKRIYAIIKIYSKRKIEMYNFFTDCKPTDNTFRITDSDYNHIKNVLRMRIGEKLLVSHGGVNYLCEISEFLSDAIIVHIIKENYFDTSLPIKIHLFQGLPKSDKLELIIQKAVELGAHEITPVQMSRSIVKIETNKKDSKTARWNSIAESAAKQSKCAYIPTVNPPLTYAQALDKCKDMDLIVVPYENEKGSLSTKELLSTIRKGDKIGVIIGPEGGFEQSEIERAVNIGAKTISLGKRILRTETAAITAVAMLMLHAEINL